MTLYTAEELAEFEANLRRDYTFGRSRRTSTADLLDMAHMAEGGEAFNDPNDRTAQRMRICVRVWRELAEQRRGAIYKNDPVDEDEQRPQGNGTGRSTDRKGMASEKQKEFLEALLEGRSDEIAVSARARIDSVGGHVNKDTASKLIDDLTDPAPGIVAWKNRMTTGQRDYLISMWVEDRGVPANTAKVVLTKVWLRSTKEQASAMIDRAKAAKSGAKALPTAEKVTDGFYEFEGTVVKVQMNQTNTGLYAKRLYLTEEGLADGFVYESGLINRLKGAKKLTPEMAAQVGPLYGKCMKCGKRLTDEESIAIGFGHDCVKAVFG